VEKNLEKALIVCTPGLERELLLELQEVWPYLLSPQGVRQAEAFPEFEKFKGGIEIPCDFFRAVQLNFFLQLATRVLWRLGEFRCRDFPKLYQNLKKIPWSQWLVSSQVNWHIAASGSRLNNEKRIAEVAEDLFKNIKLENKNFSHDIYLRMFNDVCTVSVDLSGEALYKRTLNKKTGEAPFRETWAHFVLRRMMAETPLAELKNINLMDPFCGSGTFLFEGSFFNFPNFYRHFSFQNLLRAPKLFKTESFSHNYKWPRSFLFKSASGIEKDKPTLKIALENLEAYKSHYKIGAVALDFAEGDAFKTASRAPDGPLWIVANPPWGQRLGLQRSFEDLVTGLVQAWRPHKMALVVPAESLNPSCISSDYEVQESVSLKLGGADVVLWIWQCKD
jgi:putative N6-adenine-specific DNA methylase